MAAAVAYPLASGDLAHNARASLRRDTRPWKRTGWDEGRQATLRRHGKSLQCQTDDGSIRGMLATPPTARSGCRVTREAETGSRTGSAQEFASIEALIHVWEMLLTRALPALLHDTPGSLAPSCNQLPEQRASQRHPRKPVHVVSNIANPTPRDLFRPYATPITIPGTCPDTASSPPTYDTHARDAPSDYTTTDASANAHSLLCDAIIAPRNPATRDTPMAPVPPKPSQHRYHSPHRPVSDPWTPSHPSTGPFFAPGVKVDFSASGNFRSHAKKKKAAKATPAFADWAKDDSPDDKKDDAAGSNNDAGDGNGAGSGGDAGGSGSGGGGDGGSDPPDNNGGSDDPYAGLSNTQKKKKKREEEERKKREEEEAELKRQEEEDEADRKRAEEEEAAAAKQAEEEAAAAAAAASDPWAGIGVGTATGKKKKKKKGVDEVIEEPPAPAPVPDPVPEPVISPEKEPDDPWASFGAVGTKKKKATKKADETLAGMESVDLGATAPSPPPAEVAAAPPADDTWGDFGKKKKKKATKPEATETKFDDINLNDDKSAPKLDIDLGTSGGDKQSSGFSFGGGWSGGWGSGGGGSGADNSWGFSNTTKTTDLGSDSKKDDLGWGFTAPGSSAKDTKKSNGFDFMLDDDVPKPASPPAKEETKPADDDPWSGFAAAKKDKKTKKKAGAVAEPVVEAPAPPPPEPEPEPTPPKVEEKIEEIDPWANIATTGTKKEKKKKKGAAAAVAAPVVPEPPPREPTPPPAPVEPEPEPEPVKEEKPAETDLWGSFGVPSKEKKKKKGAKKEEEKAPTPPPKEPTPPPAGDDFDVWGSLAKEKKSPGAFDWGDEVVDPMIAAPVAPAEPSPETGNDWLGGGWGTTATSKKKSDKADKKSKKSSTVAETALPPAVPELEPELEPEPTPPAKEKSSDWFGSFLGGSDTKSKEKEKKKKADAKAASPSPPPVEPAPESSNTDDLFAWGTKASTTKDKDKKKKKGATATSAPADAALDFVDVPPAAVEANALMPEAVVEPRIEDDEWGAPTWSTGTKTKKKSKDSKSKGIVEIPDDTATPPTDVLQPESVQEVAAEGEDDPWASWTTGKKAKKKGVASSTATKADGKSSKSGMKLLPAPEEEEPPQQQDLLDVDAPTSTSQDADLWGFGAASKTKKKSSKEKDKEKDKDKASSGSDTKKSKTSGDILDVLDDNPSPPAPSPSPPSKEKEEKKSSSSKSGGSAWSSLWGGGGSSAKEKEKDKEKRRAEKAAAKVAAAAAESEENEAQQRQADDDAFAAALGDDDDGLLPPIAEPEPEEPALKKKSSSSSKEKEKEKEKEREKEKDAKDSKKKSATSASGTLKSSKKSKEPEPEPEPELELEKDLDPIVDVLPEEAEKPKADGWGFWGSSLKPSTKKSGLATADSPTDATAAAPDPWASFGEPHAAATADADNNNIDAPTGKSSSKTSSKTKGVTASKSATTGSVADRIKALQGGGDTPAAPPTKLSSKSKGAADATSKALVEEPEPLPAAPVEVATEDYFTSKFATTTSTDKKSKKKSKKDVVPEPSPPPPQAEEPPPPPPSISPVPGGFPMDDFVEDVAPAPAPAPGPEPEPVPVPISKKDKKSKKEAKAAKFVDPEPEPPKEPTPPPPSPPQPEPKSSSKSKKSSKDKKKDDVDLLSSSAKKSDKLPTPPPEELPEEPKSKSPDPPKKDRAKVVRDTTRSSWGFWGASGPEPAPGQDSATSSPSRPKEESPRDASSPTEDRARPSTSTRTKSSRNTADQDAYEKATSKSSGSDKRESKSTRPSSATARGLSGMFGTAAATPPARSKSTRQSTSASIRPGTSSRRQSVAVDNNNGLISPPPEPSSRSKDYYSGREKDISPKAARVMGVRTDKVAREAGRSDGDPSSRRSRRAGPPDPYAIEYSDDQIMPDAPEDSAKDVPPPPADVRSSSKDQRPKRPGQSRRTTTYMSGGLGDADRDEPSYTPSARRSEDVARYVSGPDDYVTDRPGLVRRSTSTAKKPGFMGGFLGAFSKQSTGPPVSLDRRPTARTYESEDGLSNRNKRGSVAYDDEAAKRLRREDRRLARGASTREAPTVSTGDGNHSRKASYTDGGAATTAAATTDVEDAETRRRERRERKRRELEEEEARIARRRAAKDDSRRASRAAQAEQDRVQAREDEEREARRRARRERQEQEARAAREEEDEANRRREERRAARRAEKDRMVLEEEAAATAAAAAAAAKSSSRPDPRRRTTSYMDTGAEEDEARRARREERRLRRSITDQTPVRTSDRAARDPPPSRRRTTARPADDYAPAPAPAPAANVPSQPFLSPGTDKTASWVASINHEPPPPPPLAHTIIDAPMHFGRDDAPDRNPVDQYADDADYDEGDGPEETSARELRQKRRRARERDFGHTNSRPVAQEVGLETEEERSARKRRSRRENPDRDPYGAPPTVATHEVRSSDAGSGGRTRDGRVPPSSSGPANDRSAKESRRRDRDRDAYRERGDRDAFRDRERDRYVGEDGYAGYPTNGMGAGYAPNAAAAAGNAKGGWFRKFAGL